MAQKLFAQITIVITFFVFADGVIPAQDYDFLYQAGVVAIFARVLPLLRLLVRLWTSCWKNKFLTTDKVKGYPDSGVAFFI